MKELKLKMEAPAVRVKMIDGSDNVVGSLADGVCVLVYANTQETANELLATLEHQALLYKKLLPTIVLNKNLTFDISSDKCKIVIDNSGAFLNTYQTAIYAIDEDGIIVYTGDSLEDCFKKIAPLLTKKNKKHSHEDWMRGF